MLSSPSASPPTKRTKLEEDSASASNELETYDEDSENRCSICLQAMEDRTVIPTCSHEFCFDCLVVWAAQSRRCPLCTQAIGDYVIHDIRSRFDYRKHHLAPLRSSSPQLLLPPQTNAAVEARNTARRRRRDRERERRQREELDERDKLELSIATRRWIYKHDLYAKHVASNPFTKYRPYPTPTQFAASPDLISRTTTFLRRELQVWQGLDVEFLTNLIISLMKAIDIRSESAVKLLAEFLDMDIPYEPGHRYVNAEHFAHEVYSYVRSPYRDLFVYDSVVQYDRPPNVSPPPQARQRTRWRGRSQERPRSRGQDHSRPPSRSPRQEGHGRSPYEMQGRYRDPLPSRISSPARTHDEGSRGLQPEASTSRVARNLQRDQIREHSDIHESSNADAESMPSRMTGGEEEVDNGIASGRIASGRTAQPPPPSGDEADNFPISRRPEHNSTGAVSIPGSATPRLSRLNDPKGKREEDGRDTTPQSSGTTSDDIRAPAPPSLSNRLKNDANARERPPRQRSLLESVQAHLKANISGGQLIKPTSEDNVPRLHTPPSRDSHYQVPLRRLSLLQRLSDPVTKVVDEQSTERYATDFHQGSASGLASKIERVTSSTYPITKETTAVQGKQDLTSGAVDSMGCDSTHTNQQRPSPLSDSHQDDCRQTTDVLRTLATSAVGARPPTTSTALVFNKACDSVPTDSSGTCPSITKMRASDPRHINSVRASEEAHQFDTPHVGSTSRLTTPIYTHDPPNSAPIVKHQDHQNSKGLQSELRSKLLSRLGEERKQACEAFNSGDAYTGAGEVRGGKNPSSNLPMYADGPAPTSAVDRNSPRDDNEFNESPRGSMQDGRAPGVKGPDPALAISGTDTTELEARLRARMRLRAKLAAEKRQGEPR